MFFDFLNFRRQLVTHCISLMGLFLVFVVCGCARVGESGGVLEAGGFKHYVDYFNETDDEIVVNHIANSESWAWLEKNVPLFECSDKDIERIYYFRWWTYRKHIRQTPEGFVVTEFLPKVSWSGPHNVIACALGHHIYEGRWLSNRQYLDDYIRFWFANRELAPGGMHWVRYYSTWLADAAYQRYLVNGDKDFILSILDDLVENDDLWEKRHLLENGLFWSWDGNDGMEWSISGSGARPTLNSYMYADALAISKIAELAGKSDLAAKYKAKAAKRKKVTLEKLWDDKEKFFKVRAYDGHRSESDKPWPNDTLLDIREQLGYIPWYFNLPDAGYEEAWKQLMDPFGFKGPVGLTTAEIRDLRFRRQWYAYPRWLDGGCQWNGPVWPYATTQTLVAMANLLNNYQQEYVDRNDYYEVLQTYARSQQKNGRPWIDEVMDEKTGTWLLEEEENRGNDYNHSAYCDLVITGLVGFRPRAENVIEINPLVPDKKLKYFCLDNLVYRGYKITFLYDDDGSRYGRGKGLQVIVDGRKVAGSRKLERLTVKLPAKK